MRSYQSLLGLFCIILMNSSHATEIIPVEDFGSNPGDLRMYVQFPSGYSGDSLLPAVVVLHGCSQSAQDIAYASGWGRLGDENHFIVIYPEQRTANNVSRCFNWFKSNDHSGSEGESHSILSMVDYALKNYSIDPKNISIYGVSAGAAMAVSILVEHHDRFTQGASLAGGPFMNPSNGIQGYQIMNGSVDNTPAEWGRYLPDTDQKAPKLIVLHGSEDKVVDVRNAQEIIDQWSSFCAIDNKPSDSVRMLQDRFGYTVDRLAYKDLVDEERIVYYKIGGLGHKLPIHRGLGHNCGGAESVHTEDIEFFSTYYIAKDFGLLVLDQD